MESYYRLRNYLCNTISFFMSPGKLSWESIVMVIEKNDRASWILPVILATLSPKSLKYMVGLGLSMDFWRVIANIFQFVGVLVWKSDRRCGFLKLGA